MPARTNDLGYKVKEKKDDFTGKKALSGSTNFLILMLKILFD